MTKRAGNALLVTGMAIPQLVSIAIVAATAWSLGPAGRGEVAFAQSTAALISVVGGWGFYLSAASARGSAIPRQFFDLTIIATSLLSVGMVAWAMFVPTGLMNLSLALPIGFAAVMMAGTTYCQRVAQARVSDLEYLIIGATPPVAALIAVVPVVSLGYPAVLVVNSWAASTAIGFVVGLLRLRRLVPFQQSRPYALRRHFRSGFAVGAASVSSFLVLRVDTFLLGISSTAVQVGYYSVAAAMAGLLLYVSEVYSLRTISQYGSELEPHSYLQGSFRRARRASSISAVLIPAYIIVGWAVLTFGFPGFEPAFKAFVILCLAAVPASFVRVLVSAASMLGWRRMLGWYSILCFGLLAVYVPAAPQGATALAIASLVVYLVQAGFVSGALLILTFGGGGDDTKVRV